MSAVDLKETYPQRIQPCLAHLRQVHTVPRGQRSSGGRLQLITGMQNFRHSFTDNQMRPVQVRVGRVRAVGLLTPRSSPSSLESMEKSGKAASLGLPS